LFETYPCFALRAYLEVNEVAEYVLDVVFERFKGCFDDADGQGISVVAEARGFFEDAVANTLNEGG